MKQKKEIAKGSIIIKVDPSLDRYHHMGLFQDKIDKANHILKTVGLPKQLFKK